MDHHTDAAHELAKMAREVIDTNPYLVLGTADDSGFPRVTPVFFGHDGYRDFYWVSRPDAIHSLHVSQRPTVNAVIYDSTVRVGHGRAVYLTGRARQVADAELPDRCRVAFRPLAGARGFTPDQLSGDAALRLYLLPVEVWELYVGYEHPGHDDGPERRVPAWPAGAA
jgi:hypothetical protein